MPMDRDDFYSIAMAQGQHRLARETFEEFQRRVMALHEKRQRRPDPWRTENAASKDKAAMARNK